MSGSAHSVRLLPHPMVRAVTLKRPLVSSRVRNPRASAEVCAPESLRVKLRSETLSRKLIPVGEVEPGNHFSYITLATLADERRSSLICGTTFASLRIAHFFNTLDVRALPHDGRSNSACRVSSRHVG